MLYVFKVVLYCFVLSVQSSTCRGRHQQFTVQALQVKWTNKPQRVIWVQESDIADCSCRWPSSRSYPCRHVLRVATEYKRNIDCQIGTRWLSDKIYVEDCIPGGMAAGTEHEDARQFHDIGCTTNEGIEHLLNII